MKIGKEVEIVGDDIVTAINKGVSQGYTKYYLRKSIVSDPLNRVNTKDNTPANIYCDFVDGDKIEITILTKGGGSENASFLKMLTPLDGWQGIKNFVMESMKLRCKCLSSRNSRARYRGRFRKCRPSCKKSIVENNRQQKYKTRL